MGLPPLRWVAEEDLIYDSATNTLHRPGCPHASTVTSPRPVPAHGALQLVWAPTLCDCQPDVTIALSHPVVAVTATCLASIPCRTPQVRTKRPVVACSCGWTVGDIPVVRRAQLEPVQPRHETAGT